MKKEINSASERDTAHDGVQNKTDAVTLIGEI